MGLGLGLGVRVGRNQVEHKAGNGRPAVAYLPIGRPRLTEAGGCPEPSLALAPLALAGRAGERGPIGRSLWAAAFDPAGALEVGQPDVPVAVTVEDVESLRRVAGLLGRPDRPTHRPPLARALALLDDAEVDAAAPGLVVVVVVVVLLARTTKTTTTTTTTTTAATTRSPRASLRGS